MTALDLALALLLVIALVMLVACLLSKRGDE